MADKTEVKDFTQRELEIMGKAWSCMTSEPQVDYIKLAAACDMGNPRSASNAWATIKKKMWAKAGIEPPKSTKGKKTADGDDAESGAAATPVKTPRKRAKKAEGEEGAEGSPTKKVRTPAKKGKKSEAAVEEDGEEGASQVKKEAVEEEEGL